MNARRMVWRILSRWGRTREEASERERERERQKMIRDDFLINAFALIFISRSIEALADAE